MSMHGAQRDRERPVKPTDREMDKSAIGFPEPRVAPK